MKEIILAACGAVVLVNNIQIHLLIRVNRKPFNCFVCLAGWLCLVLTVGNYYWLEVPFMMSASMIVSVIINSLLKKLL